MGNCPSSFRAQFTPVHENGHSGTTDIIMKPMDDDDIDKDKITTSTIVIGDDSGKDVDDVESVDDEKVKKNNDGGGKKLKKMKEKNKKIKDKGEKKTKDDKKDKKNKKNKDKVKIKETGDEVSAVNNGSANDARDTRIKTLDEEPLIVEFVDTCISKNNEDHHTSDFDSAHKIKPKLIIRRGQPFKLNVVLNRAFDIEKDVLCFVFTAKDTRNPSYSQNTQVVLPVVSCQDNEYSRKQWHIEEMSSDDNSFNVQIVPAADAVVGEWLLEIDSKAKDQIDAADFHYKHDEPFIILFNPWCEDDSVYLKDKKLREEYVMAESGLIWRGSHNCLRPCIWNYAQFEENVLESCLYLLTSVGRLSVVKRADPVKVVRHISAVLNSRNNAGVLMGNWTGKYKGGLCPTTWCGSQCILQKYYKTKKPVKYGQCWVFSGVFTTVCRALGIPARPVTNFSSAHDTHNSLTVDVFYDSEGKPVEKMNIDSVWNFHVWTEVWMTRPDLEPGGYGGWQAVDSTPQEESDGAYQCGPASVEAIKRGEIMKGFDTQFLFAEVNADKVYWRYRGPRQPLKLIKKCSEEIGHCISTKAVGKFEREDITNSYKHNECSKEEREVMIRALRQCKNSFSRYYLNDELEDVQFEFFLLDDIVIGQPFTVKLKATNKKVDALEYNVDVSLRVDSTTYTGAIKKQVKKDDFEIQLGPGVEQEMTMIVEYSDYEKALVDQSSFVISANAHVKETDFDYCAQDDFRVRMPDINILVEGEIVQNKPMTVTAVLTNPLPKSIKNGSFTIEGPGLGNPVTLKCKGETKPGESASASCTFIPKTPGAKVIAAKFQSKEFTDVDGYSEFYVSPSTENNEKENNSHL